MSIQETIKLKDGRKVLKTDYVTAKTKALQQFGYEDLTEKEVSEQVDKILANDENLNVIGHFCISDIDTDGQTN